MEETLSQAFIDWAHKEAGDKSTLDATLDATAKMLDEIKKMSVESLQAEKNNIVKSLIENEQQKSYSNEAAEPAPNEKIYSITTSQIKNKTIKFSKVKFPQYTNPPWTFGPTGAYNPIIDQMLAPYSPPLGQPGPMDGMGSYAPVSADLPVSWGGQLPPGFESECTCWECVKNYADTIGYVWDTYVWIEGPKLPYSMKDIAESEYIKAEYMKIGKIKIEPCVKPDTLVIWDGELVKVQDIDTSVKEPEMPTIVDQVPTAAIPDGLLTTLEPPKLKGISVWVKVKGHHSDTIRLKRKGLEGKVFPWIFSNLNLPSGSKLQYSEKDGKQYIDIPPNEEVQLLSHPIDSYTITELIPSLMPVPKLVTEEDIDQAMIHDLDPYVPLPAKPGAPTKVTVKAPVKKSDDEDEDEDEDAEKDPQDYEKVAKELYEDVAKELKEVASFPVQIPWMMEPVQTKPGCGESGGCPWIPVLQYLPSLEGPKSSICQHLYFDKIPGYLKKKIQEVAKDSIQLDAFTVLVRLVQCPAIDLKTGQIIQYKDDFEKKQMDADWKYEVKAEPILM